MRINSKQICEYTGGMALVEPIDASKLYCGISWDSRSIEQDYLFVALPGENTDGHTHIDSALRAGALGVLVSEAPKSDTCLLAQEMGAAIIEVSNTASAITDLAREWRKKLQGRVICITGSSGKTTTKSLVSTVLSAGFSIVATEGNQNNELGVPKTILRAEPETDVVVVEMGMRGLGQITELCEYVRPDWGLVTNVSEGHIELLGSQENIAKAKAELFCALPDGYGKAFLNRSGSFTEFMREQADLENRRVETIYFNGGSDFAEKASGEVDKANELGQQYTRQGAWASDIILDERGCPSFILHIGVKSLPCTLKLRGEHNVQNACAAASVGMAMGMSSDAIAAALAKAEPECGRQEIITSRSGFTVINDSYNANPDSMRAALLMLSSYRASGRRIAVLGDMGELGSHAKACHEGIGVLVATLDIDLLIGIGESCRYIVQKALENGMSPLRAKHVESISQALAELDSQVQKGDAVLVKASRFMALERVVGGLVN